MIKVSVIIPAYNSEKYIKKAIISVYKNNFREIEVIVINDGSKDNTKIEVEKLMKTYKTLKLINIKNSGVSIARNIGIDNANGEYLMFLDSDDCISENCIEELYSTAKNKDIDIITFNHYEVKNNNLYEIKSNKANEYISGELALKNLLLNNISASIWGKFIRRSLFTKEISFENNIFLGEDLIINVKLFSKAEKVYNITDCYYYYYIRDNSVTKIVDEKTLSIQNAVNKIGEYLNENKIIDKFKDEYEFCRYLHLYFYRVIVGPISKDINKIFFESYDERKIIKRNKYYIEFIKKCKKSELIRIYLYNINYNLAVFIHKSIVEFIKKEG